MAQFYRIKCNEGQAAQYVNRDLVTDIVVFEGESNEFSEVVYGLTATGDECGQTVLKTHHETLESALAEAEMVACGDPIGLCVPPNGL